MGWGLLTSTPPTASPKFLADVMLGSLAKWLRIFGYDTAYENRITDESLVQRSLQQNRILLTRDRRLVQRRALRHRHLLIHREKRREQIQEVLEYFHEEIDPSRFLTRCIACNAGLDSFPREKARGRVPEYVYATQRSFKRCPTCLRLYWRGTHRERMLEELLALRRSGGRPG
ncbi:MAG: Mut7-C RNAse domain-containing protein [Acidobacteriota bacterium]